MEIEAVVGAVVELGERLGVPMPSTSAVYACVKFLGEHRGQRGGRRESASCRRQSQSEAHEREQSLVPARRLADRDDHDREPAVRVDAVRPAAAGEHRLEAFGHPVRLHAVHPLPDLGAAAGRLAHRSARAALVHHRGRTAVRAGLGRHGLRHVAADALRAVLRSPASARRSSTAAASARRSSGSRSGAAWRRASWRPASAAARRSSSRSSRRSSRRTAIRRRSSPAGMLQGIVIVVVAQFLRHPPAEPRQRRKGAGSRAGRTGGTSRRSRCCARRSSTHVCDVRADGDRRAARHRQRRPDATVVGLPAGLLTLAATLSPIANGASRIFWGWASDRLGREIDHGDVLHAAGDLPVPGRRRRARSRRPGSRSRWCSSTSRGDRFTRCSRPRPATTSVAEHATSNYAVLYTAKGVASIIGGWFGALLAERSGSWRWASTAAP